MDKLSQISQKVTNSIPEITDAMTQFELTGAQLGYAKLIERVFTGDSRDVNGDRLKPYSKTYAKKRKDAGLLTNRKNLQYTDSLFNSIAVGFSDGKYVVGIKDPDNAEKAENIEGNEQRRIFGLSDKEREEVVEEAKAELMLKLREIIKGWF